MTKIQDGKYMFFLTYLVKFVSKPFYMLPKTIDLTDNPERYRLILALNLREIADFVRQYFYSRTILTSIFRYFLLVSTFLFLGIFTFFIILQPAAWNLYLGRFTLGILSFFLLVPIHEIIHGAVYKYYGAPKVRFGIIWSKLDFFAAAPEFVISKKEFLPIALAPFIVINSILIFFLILSWNNPLVHIYLWGVFLMHSLGCMGDFALIGFFEEQGNKKIYTFDAAGAECSYFYEDI